MSKKTDLPDPDKWEEIISTYEDLAHPFTTLFAKDAVDAAKITSDDNLLDIATGMGAAAFAAADRGAAVTAIDFTPGMITRVNSAERSNISAQVMNGEALCFEDGAFDVTLSIFGIMLFENWQKGLEEMARVTRPGGRGVMATWQDDRGAGLNLLLFRIIADKLPHIELPAPPAGMGALSDPDVLATQMQAAGFSPPRIYAITHDFEMKTEKLEDAERLFSVAGIWGPLTSGERQIVMEEIRQRIEENAVNGILPIPSTCLMAVAAKP